MEFFHKQTKIAFMRTRKVWYALSAVMMVVSIGALVTKGLNFAIDFTGGVSVEAALPSAANVEAIRAKLAAPSRGAAIAIAVRDHLL